jgi:hypothetical protein
MRGGGDHYFSLVATKFLGEWDSLKKFPLAPTNLQGITICPNGRNHLACLFLEPEPAKWAPLSIAHGVL